MQGGTRRQCSNPKCNTQKKVTSKCSGCGSTFYCSRSCQIAHWKAGHKGRCKVSWSARGCVCACLNPSSPPCKCLLYYISSLVNRRRTSSTRRATMI